MDDEPPDEPFEEDLSKDIDVRERLEQEADRAVESFDEGIVDLLSWILDTETRARIYVHLRQHPDSTSEEISEGTGLYPSTVREALAELHGEGRVIRQKRESSGAGNNPYEYAAIAPSELVSGVVDEVQSGLNMVFNLDDHLGQREREETGTGAEPVTISVEDETNDVDDTTDADDMADADDTTDAESADDEEE
ncbi:transcriptional regulator [Halobacteriales archaeon QS_4_62_28]|nr:MAG: transcriptional regulator [Halobacteriales archaeon QS_4_62_28]